jgi:hypothetical protein
VNCPRCNTDEVDRSHRRGLGERFASLFGSLPYRCQHCGHRFFYNAAQPSRAKPNRTEREIRKTRKRIAWERRKREWTLYALGILIFLAFLYYISTPGI